MSKPEPLDKELYEKVKEEIYKKYPKHSAYRSGLLVKTYKERGGKYSGTKDKTKGLARWMEKKFKNERGEVGHRYKSDVYRPTVRITKDTPTTFQELTPQEIEKARREKARTGHVKKFKK